MPIYYVQDTYLCQGQEEAAYSDFRIRGHVHKKTVKNPENPLHAGQDKRAEMTAGGGDDPTSSSSSEDEENEGQKVLWAKVEVALEEYHLSPFAMVAAKKWVKLMADRELPAIFLFLCYLLSHQITEVPQEEGPRTGGKS